MALFSSLFGGGGGGRTLRWKVAVPAVSFKEPRKNKNKKMEGTKREREKKRAQSRRLYTLISPSDLALRQYKQMCEQGERERV